MFQRESITFRFLLLAFLAIQNSFHVIALRLSRINQAETYSTTAMVLTGEAIKALASFFVCFFVEFYSSSPLTTITAISASSSPINIASTFTATTPINEHPAQRSMKNIIHIIASIFVDAFGSSWENACILGLSLLYFTQNNVAVLASIYLDPATFQMNYQMKILSTAAFSVLILHKPLSGGQWLALGLLTSGMVLLQLPLRLETSIVSISDEVTDSSSQTFYGIALIYLACLTSGLGAAWTEKLLKDQKRSIWTRNLQLSSFSLLLGALVYGCSSSEENRGDQDLHWQYTFFRGFNLWTWVAIMLGAIGGLLVAAVVKYTDNILKCYASSTSLLLSVLISSVSFGLKLSWHYCMAACLVLVSIRLYSAEPSSLADVFAVRKGFLAHPDEEDRSIPKCADAVV